MIEKHPLDSVRTSAKAELTELVKRIVGGDPAAEEELVRRYEKGVAIIVDQIVRNQPATEDLSQDTFRIVLQKVRQGDVRNPERISGFIRGVAQNVAIDHIRKVKKRIQEEIGQAEQIPDPAPNQLDLILKEERARVVRQVIEDMKVKRYRDLLMRYYIAEQDKDQICADLGLSRAQFNNVISRATARFKELYLRVVSGREP